MVKKVVLVGIYVSLCGVTHWVIITITFGHCDVYIVGVERSKI